MFNKAKLLKFIGEVFEKQLIVVLPHVGMSLFCIYQ